MVEDRGDVQWRSTMLAAHLNVDSISMLYEDLDAIHLFEAERRFAERKEKPAR